MTDLERKEKKKEYYQKNKEKILENNKKRAEENKEKTKEYLEQYRKNNKEKISQGKKEYHQNNKETIQKKKKIYRKNNKEHIKEHNKEYYKNNKKQITEGKNKYHKNKKETDLLFKLKCNIGDLIRVSIRNNGYTKKSRTFEILGCTYKEFKLHLERQFTVGMSWDNRSNWHLDHVYPVSLAKDEADVIKLNHYTNFQPLWAADNLLKGNKVIANTQIKLV